MITLADARQQHNKNKVAITRGKNLALERQQEAMEFKALCHLYLIYADLNKRSSNADRSKIAKYIDPILGEYRVIGVNEKIIHDYLDHLKHCHLKDSTRNRHLMLIKAIFNFAIENGFCISSPVTGFTAFKENRVPARFLNNLELKKFITSAGHDVNTEAGTLFIFLAMTGLRIGEAISLMLKDYNPGLATIFIQSTKSGYGRVVVLNETAKSIIENQLRKHRTGFVFRGRDSVSAMHRPSKAFARICEAAGLQDITPHSLRHTFASLSLINGVSMFEVSRLLGHSSIRTTEQHYSHVTNERLAQASQRFDDLVMSKSG